LNQLNKLFDVFVYLIKLSAQSLFGKRKNEIKNLLTFIYRQSIFSYCGNIPRKSITDFLAKRQNELEYLVYNYYPKNEFNEKVSCLGIEESIQLSALVRFKKPKKLLEIGSNKGGTTHNFFINTLSDCEIITFDQNNISPANDVIKSSFLEGRIKTIKSDTRNLVSKLQDQTFDFIFVDAGHSYEDVKNDTECALKLLAPNGMIVWHDYCALEKGVIKYLEELSHSIKLTHLEMGTLVVYES
jgi:predicted O-methyltransferase YrrM